MKKNIWLSVTLQIAAFFWQRVTSHLSLSIWIWNRNSYLPTKFVWVNISKKIIESIKVPRIENVPMKLISNFPLSIRLLQTAYKMIVLRWTPSINFIDLTPDLTLKYAGHECIYCTSVDDMSWEFLGDFNNLLYLPFWGKKWPKSICTKLKDRMYLLCAARWLQMQNSRFPLKDLTRQVRYFALSKSKQICT